MPVENWGNRARDLVSENCILEDALQLPRSQFPFFWREAAATMCAARCAVKAIVFSSRIFCLLQKEDSHHVSAHALDRARRSGPDWPL